MIWRKDLGKAVWEKAHEAARQMDFSGMSAQGLVGAAMWGFGHMDTLRDEVFDWADEVLTQPGSEASELRKRCIDLVWKALPIWVFVCAITIAAGNEIDSRSRRNRVNHYFALLKLGHDSDDLGLQQKAWKPLKRMLSAIPLKLGWFHPNGTDEWLDIINVAALEVNEIGDCVVLLEGNEVVTLDWWDSSSFVGDKGNFSRVDKREFVQLHHDAFKSLVAVDENLFTLSLDTDETNYLANFSQAKKNYADAGGVYESDDPIFAREFLLLIGLQNFDFMSQLVNEERVVYGIPVEWTTLGGFAACLSGAIGEKYETTVKSFGKDGLVLGTASEVGTFANAGESSTTKAYA